MYVSLRGSNLRRMAGLLLVSGLVLCLNLAAQGQIPAKKAAPKKAEPASPGVVNIEEQTTLINKRLAEKWIENKFKTADRCDDFTFIRRASLDIIGRIPKMTEIDQFMNDPPSVRRSMLVDRLLQSPEYVTTWATMWTHWLMTRTGERIYREQVNLWLEEMFQQENMSFKDMVEKLITATGKTNENGAVGYILYHLGGAIPGNELAKNGQFDMVPVTSRTVRMFLGYQIQCTQCHDHPFNADWKQNHFWGVNAFFRQTERVGNPAMRAQNQMGPVQLTLKDNADFNKRGIIFFEKRNGVFLPSEPVFLDGSRLPKNAQGTRRQQLAKFITNHKNFSRAYVNRMWAHFFSRGLNAKPASDDFGEHNEVIHDELLTELGDAFAKAGYNPRSLIRWICNSEAYNLKVTANKTNDQPEAEAYFSRMLLKSMSPEQLLESLITATKPEVGQNAAALKKFREDWMNRLVVNFGDDEGNEGNYNGTVVQALLMMNGRDINEAISNEKSGRVQEAVRKTTGKRPKVTMDYIFLATLNRPATQKEYSQIIQKVPLRNRLKDQTPTAPLQDLFWALLNCNEFFLNH